MPIGTTEIGTFSALIDQAVALAGRGKPARQQLTSYARSSMREAQADVLFERDLIEDQITATANPHIWTRPANFRTFRTVRYPGEIYPKYIVPGRRQFDLDKFYYAASTYFVFKGVEINTSFDIAYYSYFAKLVYFEADNRPARYFADLAKWQYLDGNSIFVDTLGSQLLDEAAQALVTNWILFDWFDLVLEGILAKQFKVIGDTRAPSHFALFKSFIKDLLQAEVVASIDQ